MFLDQYFSESDKGISFTREQASRFAKCIADDFNPLHDVDAKRFCVPGDLLFSLVLTKAGLSQEMSFNFSGMVINDINLTFPENIDDHFIITDEKEKEYLDVSASGTTSTNASLIESLVRSYVEFSGHTFPHILVELMAENNVMINPARPMVMYESMKISLNNLDVEQVELVHSNSTLSIDGKRGKACLRFDLVSNGEVVGKGEKHMMLSGLREFCKTTMDNVVADYEKVKSAYAVAA